MRKSFFVCFKVSIFLCLISQGLFAREYDLSKEIVKCQKCHGVNFDRQVLHVSKKISSFSKEELLKSFDTFLSSPTGGKKGLMKIVLKKYSKEQREKLADLIISKK